MNIKKYEDIEDFILNRIKKANNLIDCFNSKHADSLMVVSHTNTKDYASTSTVYFDEVDMEIIRRALAAYRDNMEEALKCI